MPELPFHLDSLCWAEPAQGFLGIGPAPRIHFSRLHWVEIQFGKGDALKLTSLVAIPSFPVVF